MNNYTLTNPETIATIAPIQIYIKLDHYLKTVPLTRYIMINILPYILKYTDTSSPHKVDESVESH